MSRCTVVAKGAGERGDPVGVALPAADAGLVVPDQPPWHRTQL
ncbi:hypothetical protein [Flexivirga oryzae]|uniref:Uncharacterized protein n=1 Tax=Flexivirga oryzae TaxID=1794944 RepID=A0A839N6S4_9MICO|nr:hypothetical protein [Flexivirga oryzae]MBB2893440.1 hypothetical protein [Flexivirga oryzae]